MKQLLKVSDVQQILNIGRRQAYELVNQPNFPKIRVGSKSIRIPPMGLENWVRFNMGPEALEIVQAGLQQMENQFEEKSLAVRKPKAS